MVQDIRIDKDGNLRCASCGGKNFHGRRTASDHVVGLVTIGFGALLAKKKLRCQACGTYNMQGNARVWKEPGKATVGAPKVGEERSVGVDDDGDFRCWHCGFTEFVSQKCKRCGHRNDMSNPSPWKGPASKKNWD